MRSSFFSYLRELRLLKEDSLSHLTFFIIHCSSSSVYLIIIMASLSPESNSSVPLRVTRSKRQAIELEVAPSVLARRKKVQLAGKGLKKSAKRQYGRSKKGSTATPVARLLMAPVSPRPAMSDGDLKALQEEIRQLRLVVARKHEADVAVRTRASSVIELPAVGQRFVMVPPTPRLAIGQYDVATLPLPPPELHLPVVDKSLVIKLEDRREYVDLEQLLPQNRTKLQDIDGPSSSTGRNRAPSSGKRRIVSFDDWLEAFSLFCRYRGFYHPDLMVPMVGYINIIRKLAKQFSVSSWQAYDAQFRLNMQQAERDDSAWLVHDLALWSDTLLDFPQSAMSSVVTGGNSVAGNRPAPVRTCYHCEDPSHLLPSCPLRRSLPRVFPSQPFPFRFPNFDRGHGHQSPATSYFPNNNNQQAGSSFHQFNNQPPQPPFWSPQPRQHFPNFSKSSSGIAPSQQVCQAFNYHQCEGPGCLDGRLHICNVCFSKEHRASYHTTSNNPSG